ATRFAGSSSFGTKKILYMLGGVDSWYGTNLIDDENQVANDVNYGYSTYSTNLRGFKYNIRNGGSYALINNELRVPLFAYLYNKPIRSKFVENFQIIGFYDAGTAWEGISPYEEDNPLNIKEFGGGNNPVKIVVNYFRNPVVSGYGFGFRSIVFGYFMRLDFAWGIEDDSRLPGVTYFSMTLDF
ncbi:MAG: hypothetical protein IH946_03725, partial [Bacteroidetes bacterium]|nr:hypothetical protein [Bacteroidota bacterium]